MSRRRPAEPIISSRATLTTGRISPLQVQPRASGVPNAPGERIRREMKRAEVGPPRLVLSAGSRGLLVGDPDAAAFAARVASIEDRGQHTGLALCGVALLAVVRDQEDVVLDLDVTGRHRARQVEVEVEVGKASG